MKSGPPLLGFVGPQACRQLVEVAAVRRAHHKVGVVVDRFGSLHSAKDVAEPVQSCGTLSDMPYIVNQQCNA